LPREKVAIVDACISERLSVAVVLSDKQFWELFQGKPMEQWGTLSAMVKDILATDPEADTRVNSGCYGLNGGEAQRFFVTLVCPQLVYSRSLFDVLERSKKHVDNPYLVKPQ
jgi:hypothetical protein